MANKSLENNNFRIYSAQKFLEALYQSQLSVNNLYCYIGKIYPWTDNTNPDQPNDTVESRVNTYFTMLAIKKISPSDVSLVIPRYNWVSGTAYTQYDSAGATIGGISYDLFEPTLSIPPFFVYTTDNNVYKCLSNDNGSNSYIMPTGTGTTPITTSDGYIWKFMFQVSADNILKFLSTNWIPIYTLTSNDGSLQWSVQETAIPGTIELIQVTNGGSGYTTTPSVLINGNGNGCTATANISGGSVTSINILTKGSGYSNASVTFGGPGTNAAAHVIISPGLAHGSYPINELGAMYAMVDVEFNYDESGKITVSNEYNDFGLLLNPFTYGSTIPYESLIGTLTTNITLNTVSGSFITDDLIIDATSQTIIGTMVDYNSVTKIMRLNQNLTNCFVGETITNSEGSGTAIITSIVLPDIQPNTGLILTTYNMSGVTRAPNQIEELKIVIPF